MKLTIEITDQTAHDLDQAAQWLNAQARKMAGAEISDIVSTREENGSGLYRWFSIRSSDPHPEAVIQSAPVTMPFAPVTAKAQRLVARRQVHQLQPPVEPNASMMTMAKHLAVSCTITTHMVDRQPLSRTAASAHLTVTTEHDSAQLFTALPFPRTIPLVVCIEMRFTPLTVLLGYPLTVRLVVQTIPLTLLFHPTT
jgi:hypothetical protein